MHSGPGVGGIWHSELPTGSESMGREEAGQEGGSKSM